MSAELNFLPHRDPVGPIFESQQRQENDVFEFAEIIAARHYLYNIDQITLQLQFVIRRNRSAYNGLLLEMGFQDEADCEGGGRNW